MATTDVQEQLAARDQAVGRDWIWLTSLWPCQLAQNGDALRGFSFCPRGRQWLMTVRLTLDEVLQVAFTCTGTPSACVASFRKRWDDETLQFFPDKYA